MFGAKADLSSDFEEKEQKRIERKRQAEAERQKRIFDSKSRTMGVDTAFLEQQIKEKKEREQLEKQRDLLYGSRAFFFFFLVTFYFFFFSQNRHFFFNLVPFSIEQMSKWSKTISSP